MAAGYLPEPGTEYGPCENDCQHTDCAATRMDAASLCRICVEPIGYERGFYREGTYQEHRLVHAVCALTEAETG